MYCGFPGYPYTVDLLMELHHSVMEQVLQLCMDLLNSGLEELTN